MTGPLYSVVTATAAEVGTQAQTKLKDLGVDLDKIKENQVIQGIGYSFGSLKEFALSAKDLLTKFIDPSNAEVAIELNEIKKEIKKEVKTVKKAIGKSE